jgi:transposase-like protein
MTPPADPERYKNHRFPGEIISHGVWLYYRFPLSYRDVQEILFERGIEVTHEAIRRFCQVVEAETLIRRAGAPRRSYLLSRRLAPYP